MKVVSSAYARENLPELLQAVSKGDRILIARHNRPMAELVPPSQSNRPIPKFGTGKGRVKILDPKWADPMTNEEVDAFNKGEY